VEDPDPTDAIHETDHEMVHAMNEEDGIDDDTGWLSDPVDGEMDFTEEEIDEINNHVEVGEIARALDYDGAAPPGGAPGPPGGTTRAAGGSEYDGGSDVPSDDDVSFEIDWASGLWIDTTTDDNSMSVDVYFSPMEGW